MSKFAYTYIIEWSAFAVRFHEAISRFSELWSTAKSISFLRYYSVSLDHYFFLNIELEIFGSGGSSSDNNAATTLNVKYKMGMTETTDEKLSSLGKHDHKKNAMNLTKKNNSHTKRVIM